MSKPHDPGTDDPRPVDRWTDDRLDRELRQLFGAARRPAAPADLGAYPAEVVSRRPEPGSASLGPSRRPLVLAAAGIAAAVVLTAMLLGFRPSSLPANPTLASGRTAVPASGQPTATGPAPSGPVETLPAALSAGGFTWHLLALPTEANTLSWQFRVANGRTFGFHILAGSTEVWLSADRLAWRNTGALPRSETNRVDIGNAVVWDGRRYVIAGGEWASGQTNREARPRVWTSADGETWTLVQPEPGRELGYGVASDIVYGNGLYVMLVGGDFWQSKDLAHWTMTLGLLGTDTDKSSAVLRFHEGVFVAARTGSDGGTSALWSTDGMVWTKVSLGGRIGTLVDTSGGFRAWIDPYQGSGAMLDSSDGRTWRPSGETARYAGPCNRDMFLCIAPAPGQALIYSPDGRDWVQIPWPAAFPTDARTFGMAPCPGSIFITILRLGQPAAVYWIEPGA